MLRFCRLNYDGMASPIDQSAALDAGATVVWTNASPGGLRGKDGRRKKGAKRVRQWRYNRGKGTVIQGASYAKGGGNCLIYDAVADSFSQASCGESHPALCDIPPTTTWTTLDTTHPTLDTTLSPKTTSTTTVTTTTTPCVLTSQSDGPHGGWGGSSFSDSAYVGNGLITAVRTRMCGAGGCWLNYIRVQYGGVWAPGHGTSGGTEQTVYFNPGETIDWIEGAIGALVDRLRFYMHQGTSHGPLGGSGGSYWRNYNPDSSHCYVREIRGRTGDSLDQLTFIYECSTCPL